MSDIHVFVTHLQAGYKQHREVAASQLSELTAFIQSRTSHSRNPILLLGDFNIDARNSQEKSDIDMFCKGANLSDSLVWDSSDLRPSTSLDKDRCSLDYIFYRTELSNMTPIKSDILPLCSSDGLSFMGALSDHCLLKTTFKLSQPKLPSPIAVVSNKFANYEKTSPEEDLHVTDIVDSLEVAKNGSVDTVAPVLKE